jgi:hypothetical protein
VVNQVLESETLHYPKSGTKIAAYRKAMKPAASWNSFDIQRVSGGKGSIFRENRLTRMGEIW